MSEISLSLLVIRTRQIEAVRFFYETLGVNFVEERHGAGPVHFAGHVGATLLEIYPLTAGEADTTTRLGFTVADLGWIIESLWRRNLSPLKQAQQSEWGLRFVVKDPDGRSVELLEAGK
jgi:hypothetical protein